MPRPALDTTKIAKIKNLTERIERVLLPMEFLKRNIEGEEMEAIDTSLRAALEQANQLLAKLEQPAHEEDETEGFEDVIGSVIQFVMKDGDARRHLRDLLDRHEVKEKSGRRK